MDKKKPTTKKQAVKKPLTKKQWETIKLRVDSGEAVRAIARDFGVSDTAIRKKFGLQTKKVKQVANQIFNAENALKSLDLASQVRVQTVLEEMRSMHLHLAGAGKLGAMNAHKMMRLASIQLEKVDEVDPMASSDIIQTVSGLTTVANNSAHIGLNMMKAAKDSMSEEKTKEQTAQVSFYIPNNGRN